MGQVFARAARAPQKVVPSDRALAVLVDCACVAAELLRLPMWSSNWFTRELLLVTFDYMHTIFVTSLPRPSRAVRRGAMCYTIVSTIGAIL